MNETMKLAQEICKDPLKTVGPTYLEICKRECEWCAKGIQIGPGRSHLDDNGYANWQLGRDCTAPTRDQIIERAYLELAAERKRLKVALEAIETAPHGRMCQRGGHATLGSPCNCWKSRFTEVANA